MYAVQAVRQGIGIEDPERPPVEDGESLAPIVDVQVRRLPAVHAPAHALVLVLEPGNRIADVVQLRDLPQLHRRRARLAAAEEIAGREGELAEEAVEAGVSRAEVELVARRLLPLHRDVDGLLA